MPSVVGVLEQHELAARRRVDGLYEEADHIQAELVAAEQVWHAELADGVEAMVPLVPRSAATLQKCITAGRGGLAVSEAACDDAAGDCLAGVPGGEEASAGPGCPAASAGGQGRRATGAAARERRAAQAARGAGAVRADGPAVVRRAVLPDTKPAHRTEGRSDADGGARGPPQVSARPARPDGTAAHTRRRRLAAPPMASGLFRRHIFRRAPV